MMSLLLIVSGIYYGFTSVVSGQYDGVKTGSTVLGLCDGLPTDIRFI